MSHSSEIDQLATAMAAAQGEMKAAIYNRKTQYKSKDGHIVNFEYADLASVFDTIRAALSKHGVWTTQTMERVLIGDAQGTELYLRTALIHKSGQWIDSYHPLPSGVPPQVFGSALTYARRYSLAAIVGVASDEDDDANEAQKADVAPRKPEVSKPVPLSEAEKEDIMFYAKELNSDRLAKFLVWLNVKSVDEIGKHQFDRAISGLKKAVGDIVQ